MVCRSEEKPCGGALPQFTSIFPPSLVARHEGSVVFRSRWLFELSGQPRHRWEQYPNPHVASLTAGVWPGAQFPNRDPA